MLSKYFNGMQLKHSINGDQAVAYGAAIQAAVKAGSKQGHGLASKLTVQNVSPFTIGTNVKDGKLSVLVPKGSKIPCSHENSWYTIRDNQTEVAFNIYEGADPVAENNRQLGKFVLNVPSMKAREAKMRSTTVVDDEGILTVRAVCLIDGAENSIVIDTYKGRMTKAEIEQHRLVNALRA